jgi:tol-pal system protein YbgF
LIPEAREFRLKKKALSALCVAGLWALSSQPVFGVSREIIRIMQQLDTLQATVQIMQKTIDTQSAVLRTLVDQMNDNVNGMKQTVADMQKSSQKNLAATDARLDTLTSQIQALSENVEEAKARLAKLNDQVTKTQNIIQTLNTPPAPQVGPPGTNPAGPGGAAQQPALPDPDTLYKSGLSDLSSGQYDLAIQAFQEFLKDFGDSDLASNAQFYIGECYYSQKNYTQAIEEYNKCLDRYPSGNKLAAAQLKKSYALAELNQKTAAERELRSLIQRFPNSREADLAKQRLRILEKKTR